MSKEKSSTPDVRDRERCERLLKENYPASAVLVHITYAGGEIRKEAVKLPIPRRKARRKAGVNLLSGK